MDRLALLQPLSLQAEERRGAVHCEQRRSVEAHHVVLARQVDSALDQVGVGLTVGILDDPGLQIIARDQVGSQSAVRAVVAVKADCCRGGRVVAGENCSLPPRNIREQDELQQPETAVRRPLARNISPAR